MAKPSKETDAHILEFLLGVYEPRDSEERFIGLQDMMDDVIILCEICQFTGYNRFAQAKRPGRIRTLISQHYMLSPGEHFVRCLPLLSMIETMERAEAFNRKWKLKCLIS